MRSLLHSGLVLVVLLSLASSTSAQQPSPPVLPAEGFWYDPERPGTGFSLEHRGDTVAVAFYHFTDAGRSDWGIATGTLSDATLSADLHGFTGGSCLGCTPYVPSQAAPTDTTVQLVFQSSREATLQVDAGTPRRVVAMAYGGDYVDTDVAPADVPLPDLRGRWLIGGDSLYGGMLRLDELIRHEQSLEFRGDAIGFGWRNSSMTCGPNDDATANLCVLTLDSLPNLSPAPVEIARFRLGGIGEERMHGATSDGTPVLAWRVEDTEVQP